MYWDRKIFIMHSYVNSNKTYEETPKSPPTGRACPDRSDAHAPIVSEVNPASKVPPLPPPSSKEKAIPATPEEEEEISKRFRERPKDLPKIKSNKAWRGKVLEDIRSQSTNEIANLEQIRMHHVQAVASDMTKNSEGEMICAYADRVEFSCGSKVRIVRYDLPDKEWYEQTGWK
jgi:hypothetical protein